MDGWLEQIGAVVMAVLVLWGALLAAGILTVKANGRLDSRLMSWADFHGWAPVLEPSPLLVKAAGADGVVLSVRGPVAGCTGTVMYVSGFESYYLACALRLPGGTGRVELRRRGRLSYASLRCRALLRRRPRTHDGLPNPDVLDLGFERAYRVAHAAGGAVALITPQVRRSLSRAAASAAVRRVEIVDDLVLITADTWIVHGHLDPIVDALTTVASGSRSEAGG